MFSLSSSQGQALAAFLGYLEIKYNKFKRTEFCKTVENDKKMVLTSTQLAISFKGGKNAHEWHPFIRDELKKHFNVGDLDAWIMPVYNHLYEENEPHEIFKALKIIFPRLRQRTTDELKILSHDWHGKFMFARYRHRDEGDAEHDKYPVLCGTSEIEEYDPTKNEPFLRVENKIPDPNGESKPITIKGVLVPVGKRVYHVGTKDSDKHPIFFGLEYNRENHKIQETNGMLTRQISEGKPLIATRLLYKRTTMPKSSKDRKITPLKKSEYFDYIPGHYSESDFKQLFNCRLNTIRNSVSHKGADTLRSSLPKSKNRK